jgi:hypothetical protein
VEPVAKKTNLKAKIGPSIQGIRSRSVPASCKVKVENDKKAWDVNTNIASVDKKWHAIHSNNMRVSDLPDFSQDQT